MTDTPRDRIASPSRRRFLDSFLGASTIALAGAILYPVFRFISPPRVPEATGNRVLAGKVSELGKEGWKIFPFGSEPGILIQTAPGEGTTVEVKIWVR